MEQNPLTREPSVYHFQFMRSLDRPVFMDGRPHPPAYAPHSWTGFSTGEWIGNTLKITTTHLKDGFLRRGGPQTTDIYAMTEFLTRHDDILTIVTVIDDPLFQDQPYVHSTTYSYDLNNRVNMETCNGSFAENGGTDRHYVPHFLPGENADILTEWITKGGLITGGARNPAAAEDWVPLIAARGGVKTLYPEYRATLTGSITVDALKVPASRSAVSAEKMIAAQSPRDGQVHVLPVQGNVYMLVADGTNITASLGADGITLVNTGQAGMSDKVLTAVSELARTLVSPIGGEQVFRVELSRNVGLVQPLYQYSHHVAGTRPADSLCHQHERNARLQRREREACDGGVQHSKRWIRCGRRDRRGRRGAGARKRAQPLEHAGCWRDRSAGRRAADRDLLRRLLQAAGVLQRRGRDRLSRA